MMDSPPQLALSIGERTKGTGKVEQGRSNAPNSHPVQRQADRRAVPVARFATSVGATPSLSSCPPETVLILTDAVSHPVRRAAGEAEHSLDDPDRILDPAFARAGFWSAPLIWCGFWCARPHRQLHGDGSGDW